MIQDFSKSSRYTLEVEVTPYCNFNCPYCDNKHCGEYSSYSRFNQDMHMLQLFVDAFQKFINTEVVVILNGGEPTFNEGTLKFIHGIEDNQNVFVYLYSNMSQDIRYYEEACKNRNCTIYATYHTQCMDIHEYEQKVENIVNAKCIFPFEGDAIPAIKKPFEPQLLENIEYSFAQLKKSDVLMKQFALKKSLCKQQSHTCSSISKYLYINGDGSIYRCMFNNDTFLGYIKNLDFNFLSNVLFNCEMKQCFYKF